MFGVAQRYKAFSLLAKSSSKPVLNAGGNAMGDDTGSFIGAMGVAHMIDGCEDGFFVVT